MSEAFIPVGALGEGFAPEADILEPTGDLSGTHFTLDIDGPRSFAIGDGVASWDAHTDVPVRVTSVRSGIYLVDGALPGPEVRAESAYTRVQHRTTRLGASSLSGEHRGPRLQERARRAGGAARRTQSKDWVLSDRQVHPALVSDELFLAVQGIS